MKNDGFYNLVLGNGDVSRYDTNYLFFFLNIFLSDHHRFYILPLINYPV